jgi:fibro-slime domain-containing protein
MLFGNYGGTGHNYHFTFQFTGQFSYNAGTGQIFSFTGDDDVWAFLDNRLAIDLGGAHNAATGSVALDTFMAGKPTGTYPFDFFFAERHTSQSNFAITTSTAIVPEPSAIIVAILSIPAIYTANRFRRGRRSAN